MVTIDRERLVSEKQNNKAIAEGARLPKEAMLLRAIFKFTKPSLDAFRPFGLISRASQGPRDPPIALTLTFIKQTNTKHKTYVPFTFKRGSFRRTASCSTMD